MSTFSVLQTVWLRRNNLLQNVRLHCRSASRENCQNYQIVARFNNVNQPPSQNLPPSKKWPTKLKNDLVQIREKQMKICSVNGKTTKLNGLLKTKKKPVENLLLAQEVIQYKSIALSASINACEKLKQLKNDLVQIREKQMKFCSVKGKPDKLKGVMITKKKPVENDLLFAQEEIHYKSTVLSAYIDACEKSGQISKVLDIFKQIPPIELSIEPFEHLLKALARSGSFVELQKIWSVLSSSDKTLTLKCYSAVIQCLGNEKLTTEPDDSSTKIGRNLIQELKNKHGADVCQKLLDLSPRSKRDYEQLIAGIRLGDPEFQPGVSQSTMTEKSTNFYVNNTLLNPLSDGNIANLSPQLDHLKLTDLRGLYRAQVEAEQQGIIEIPSIVKPTQSGNLINFLF
jgi:hypothetical protein